MYAQGPLRNLKGDLSAFPAHRQVASSQLSEKEQIDNLTEQVNRLTAQIDSLIRQRNSLTAQLCHQNAFIDKLMRDRLELLSAYAAKSREYTQLAQHVRKLQQRLKGQSRRVAFGDQSVVELSESVAMLDS